MLLSSSVRPVSMPFFRFRYSALLHFLSPIAVSPHSGYLSASAFFLSVSGLFPLAFALGSGYLALGTYPYRYALAASFLLLPQRPHVYYHAVFCLSTTFFDFLLIFLLFIDKLQLLVLSILPYCLKSQLQTHRQFSITFRFYSVTKKPLTIRFYPYLPAALPILFKLYIKLI